MSPRSYTSNQRCRSRARVHRDRLGAATLELAITVPLMVTLIFGTIEVCQRIFLRQTAVIAAYEGARLASRRTATTEQVIARCQSILTSRRAANATVSITPQPVQNQPTGSVVRVTITIPWAGNTPISFVTAGSSNVVVNAAMVRE